MNTGIENQGTKFKQLFNQPERNRQEEKKLFFLV